MTEFNEMVPATIPDVIDVPTERTQGSLLAESTDDPDQPSRRSLKDLPLWEFPVDPISAVNYSQARAFHMELVILEAEGPRTLLPLTIAAKTLQAAMDMIGAQVPKDRQNDMGRLVFRVIEAGEIDSPKVMLSETLFRISDFLWAMGGEIPKDVATMFDAIEKSNEAPYASLMVSETQVYSVPGTDTE